MDTFREWQESFTQICLECKWNKKAINSWDWDQLRRDYFNGGYTPEEAYAMAYADFDGMGCVA